MSWGHICSSRALVCSHGGGGAWPVQVQGVIAQLQGAPAPLWLLQACIAILTGFWQVVVIRSWGRSLFLILNPIAPGWAARETDPKSGLGHGKLPAQSCVLIPRGHHSSLWALVIRKVKGCLPVHPCASRAESLLPKPRLPACEWVWGCAQFHPCDSGVGGLTEKPHAVCSVSLFFMLSSLLRPGTCSLSLDSAWVCVLGGGGADGRVSNSGWVRLAYSWGQRTHHLLCLGQEPWGLEETSSPDPLPPGPLSACGCGGLTGTECDTLDM